MFILVLGLLSTFSNPAKKRRERELMCLTTFIVITAKPCLSAARLVDLALDFIVVSAIKPSLGGENSS